MLSVQNYEVNDLGQTITMYDLLLSCPGDAYDECYPAVRSAIDEFNKEAQRNFSIGVCLSHWSTDSYPQSGDKAQELLNSQIVDSADMAIAIFWTRFGTPTDKYGSGTEEEIDRFIRSNKQLFLYFFDKPIPPSITDSRDYFENRNKITKLKEKYNGIYNMVENETELKKKIIDHLKLHLFKNNAKCSQMTNNWFRSDTEKMISKDELIVCGNTKAQLDGNIARVEVKRSDGTTVYAEMDARTGEARNIKTDGFPQEYTIDIPDSLTVSKQHNMIAIRGITYRVEIDVLKFDGYLKVLYDIANNKIQDFTVKAPAGMKVFLDSTNKTVCLVDDSKCGLNN